MKWLTKLMEDAKPRAEVMHNVVSHATNGVMANPFVQIAKNLGYAGLRDTVGVAVVLAAPKYKKAKRIIRRWAEPVEATKQ